MKNKALFIDLDGVILKTSFIDGKIISAQSVHEAEVLPGVLEALLKSRNLGFLNIVITNQPEIARGNYPLVNFEEIREWLLSSLPLDAVYVCVHDNGDGCNCRKPKPGLIYQGIEDWDINVSSSFLIGDRWKDVEAGHAAKLRTFYIPSFMHEESPREPFVQVNSLKDAVFSL